MTSIEMFCKKHIDVISHTFYYLQQLESKISEYGIENYLLQMDNIDIDYLALTQTNDLLKIDKLYIDKDYRGKK